jgi:hypothetical protein
MFCSMEEQILSLFAVWAALRLDVAQHRRSDFVTTYVVDVFLA